MTQDDLILTHDEKMLVDLLKKLNSRLTLALAVCSWGVFLMPPPPVAAPDIWGDEIREI